MKELISALVLIAGGGLALGQGVLLGPGQSCTFEFTSIPDLRPAQFGDPSQVIAWFEPGTFERDTSALLEIFPNNLSELPLTNSVAMAQYPDTVGLPYWWNANGPNAQAPLFPDLQGVLRVTMLSGTAQLSHFEVSEVVNGEFYSGSFVVPEPASAGLFVAGGVLLVVFRAFRKAL